MPIIYFASDQLALNIEEDGVVYATAEIIAVDNRIMVKDFLQEESPKAKALIIGALNKLREEFGGKICLINPPDWIKEELRTLGFTCESKAPNALRLRRTTPEAMKEGIQTAVLKSEFGGDDEPLEPQYHSQKVMDSFELFDQKFNVLRGQEVADNASRIVELARKSHFAQALIDRCLAAGGRGFQTPHAIAIETKDTHELVAYVCIDTHGEYGYFGNTFVNREAFFGRGRQAGTAYLYDKALPTIFSKCRHLLVTDPPKRDGEFDTNFKCERLLPEQNDVFVNFSDPMGLEKQLTPPYDAKDTRFHYLIAYPPSSKEALGDYVNRIRQPAGEYARRFAPQ